MKNLILVIALTVTVAYANGQSDSISFNIEITELANNILNEYNSYSVPYLIRKDGDNDLYKTIGILEFIFSDDTSKYKYGTINPRINMLLVHNLQDNPEVPFYKWIEENIDTKKYSDTTKYRIVYEGFGYGSEDLRIHDVTTGKCIRWIAIWYDNFNEANEYQNLGSISDNIYN
tara:strand:- start:1413 stop:1934 length:522 start_codon:yes stop_codon:yes gene_type:complete